MSEPKSELWGRIEANQSRLVETLNLSATFIVMLVQKKVIDADFREELELPMTRRRKNAAFIKGLLEKGTEESLEAFCEILRHRDINRADVADLLQAQLSATDVDGRVERIQPTSSSFYEAKKGTAYPMFMKSRGSVLIINAKKFPDRDEERTGTDKDRDDLKKLFKDLHFENITVCNDDKDLTAEGIKKQIELFASKIPEDAQACIVCVLSHGFEDHILGTDEGKVNIEESILKPITDLSILDKKPKMFIFQACRQRPKMKGDSVTDDVIQCFPTQRGTKAGRYDYGSPYIQTIVDIFRAHAHHKHVKEMLDMVEKEVVSLNIGMTPVYDGEGLRLPFFFFPGIFRDDDNP